MYANALDALDLHRRSSHLFTDVLLSSSTLIYIIPYEIIYIILYVLFIYVKFFFSGSISCFHVNNHSFPLAKKYLKYGKVTFGWQVPFSQ